MKISAIILAAGYSSRMGSMKMLLPMGVCNMLERTIGSFLAAGIEEVFVVTGFEAEKIEQCAAGLRVHTVRNTSFAEGMFSSIQAGVRALPQDVDAFFVMPGDIPFVDPGIIRELAAGITPENMILYPRFEGRKGHPPLISAKLRDEIQQADIQLAGGLKGVLSRHENMAAYLNFADPALLMDLDYQEEYRKAACFSAMHCPDEAACHVLLRKHRTPERVISHCVAVAKVARILAEAVCRAEVQIDTNLTCSAALLHDICRTAGKEHPAAGAALLKDLGQPKVADIIACHMDLEPANQPKERELVYLADKLVKDDRVISFREHMQMSKEAFRENSIAQREIQRRLDAASQIAHAIEKLTGMSLSEILDIPEI